MSYFQDKRRKLFKKMCEKQNLKGKDKKFIKGIINTVNSLIWMIAKFACMYWIYMNVYDRIGFEKTLITAILLLTIIIRSALKPPTI